MGDIVNLRQARKSKKRADKEKAAATNRTVYGRTKAERTAAEAEQRRADATLDGARRGAASLDISSQKPGDS